MFFRVTWLVNGVNFVSLLIFSTLKPYFYPVAKPESWEGGAAIAVTVSNRSWYINVCFYTTSIDINMHVYCFYRHISGWIFVFLLEVLLASHGYCLKTEIAVTFFASSGFERILDMFFGATRLVYGVNFVSLLIFSTLRPFFTPCLPAYLLYSFVRNLISTIY